MSSSSGQHIESALAPYAEQLYYARRPDLPPSKTAMPRPNPPPTPGSSSDIRGKEGNHAAPVFNLPPTAYQEQDRASTSSTASSGTGSDSSYRPASPTSRDAPRKRQNTGPVITKDDFALPPPPTRSRKIIQMQPSTEQEAATNPTAKMSTGKTQTTAQTGSKRKQNNNGTTAAGRKIARKTAHSLIERRRRSKMNEEFGVLKDMIPACKGQEMHKLAILQVRQTLLCCSGLILLTVLRRVLSILATWSSVWRTCKRRTHLRRLKLHRLRSEEQSITKTTKTMTRRWRMKKLPVREPLLR